jgi:L-ascorbate metabolism protein UlaG (beta-lactamase superfamily)
MTVKKGLALILLLLMVFIFIPAMAKEMITLERVRDFAENNIEWAGNASIRLTGEKTIYVDPAANVKSAPADIVLITHEHHDHFNKVAVKRLIGPETIVIAPAEYIDGTVILKAGEKTVAHGLEIEAVPAYNIDKHRPHPKEKGWVGYIITLDGIRIYVSGDTDRIPEMKEIKADIAILSVGGSYMMNDQEGVLAALDIQPKIVIPVHYLGVVANPGADKRLKKGLQDQIEVVVKPLKAF